MSTLLDKMLEVNYRGTNKEVKMSYEDWAKEESEDLLLELANNGSVTIAGRSDDLWAITYEDDEGNFYSVKEPTLQSGLAQLCVKVFS